MSDVTERSGSCLCGEVRVKARSSSNSVGVCHCDSCRSWGGGPFMTIDCGTDVSIEPMANVGVFDSSQWADRGFCKKCGSHLFYRLKGNQQYILPAGLFGVDDKLVFDHQVFIDEKPSFYAFANETNDMTGPELFAKYAPPSE